MVKFFVETYPGGGYDSSAPPFALSVKSMVFWKVPEPPPLERKQGINPPRQIPEYSPRCYHLNVRYLDCGFCIKQYIYEIKICIHLCTVR